MGEETTVVLDKKMLLIFGIIVVVALALFSGVQEIPAPINNLSEAVIVHDSTDQQPQQNTSSLQVTQAQIGNSVGNLAPDFTITSIDGKQISLSDSRKDGKPVLIYFFASWCPFCKQDLTAVKSVYPKYMESVDFVIIDLDLTESLTKIKNYRDTNGYVGEFAPGTQKILIDYAVLSTTTKYAVDREGIIVWKSSGAIGSSDWDNLFSSLSEL